MSSVRDILVISILLFAIGITLMFVVKVGHTVNTNLLSISTINSSSQAVSVINHSDAAINKVDYIYMALFIAFFISLLVAGWFIGGEPIIAPIYFFVVIIFSFVSVILQLVWSDIAASSQVSAVTLSLPITTFILSHLGYFTVVMGLLGILAMFAKPQGSASY